MKPFPIYKYMQSFNQYECFETSYYIYISYVNYKQFSVDT